MAVNRRVEVSQFLASIELETGTKFQGEYLVSGLSAGIGGHVQISIYPLAGDADARVFNLLDGLTPNVERAIRHWFTPHLRLYRATGVG